MHEDVYRSRIVELRAMFLATKSILHNGEKGALREAFLINLIQQFLPSTYGIGSGVVIDKFGKQSVQVDIVIYDRRGMPPVLEAAGRGIYPIDSVVRAIEVKSNLRKSSLDQFSEMIKCFDPDNPEGLKVASSGRLPDGETFYPVCALFAFESNYKGFADECEASPVISGSQSLICLDGVGLWTHRPDYAEKLRLPYNGRYMTFKDDTQGLRLFIGMLLDQIETASQSRAGYRPLDWLI